MGGFGGEDPPPTDPDKSLRGTGLVIDISDDLEISDRAVVLSEDRLESIWPDITLKVNSYSTRFQIRSKRSRLEMLLLVIGDGLPRMSFAIG